VRPVRAASTFASLIKASSSCKVVRTKQW
jgi:hypothetical protein